MRFATANLGCKVNRVELDDISASLLAGGWRQVSQDADVVVVNTCTVTAEADRKTRKAIGRALRANPRARILVTGCAAALDTGSLAAIDERVQVVDKDAVVPLCLGEGCALEGHAGNLRVGEGFPTRVGLKVQDGCDSACTYCIVPKARGKATSLPLEACIAQAGALSAAGVGEIVLTGIDLGAWRQADLDLVDLVMAMRTAAPGSRIRLSSIEPTSVSPRLVDLLASEEGMVCRHLHIPLQSGSSKVLREMGRCYDAPNYLDLVASLKQSLPGISLTTDVIVGFPGETSADFEATCDVARSAGFSRIHIFRYSRRQGTPAADRADQVAPVVAHSRMEALRLLARELRDVDAQSRMGSRERLVAESPFKARSESYYEVSLSHSHEVGSMFEATLDNLGKDGMFYL